MTIAIDIRTGAVVGQEATGTAARDTPVLPDYVRLLTAKGYMLVPRSSVRIEELR